MGLSFACAGGSGLSSAFRMFHREPCPVAMPDLPVEDFFACLAHVLVHFPIAAAGLIHTPATKYSLHLNVADGTVYVAAMLRVLAQ